MHIEGRRIHIAGSADKNTPDYLLHYAHELVANLVRALSKEGATFIVGVGKEPLARPDDPSSPAIIFDWTLLKVAHKCLKDGVSLAQGPQGRLIAAVATSKLDQQIPESHQQIWKELREEKAVKLEFIEPGWTSGAIRRTRQAQLGDIRNYSVFRWSRATGPPGVSLPLWLSDSGSSGVWLDNNSASSLCQAFTTTQLRGWGKITSVYQVGKTNLREPWY